MRRLSVWTRLSLWAQNRPGAGGFLILAPLVALVGAAVLVLTLTSRTYPAEGVVTEMTLAESDRGSFPYAYISTATGPFGAGLPRGAGCRAGSKVTVLVTRTLITATRTLSLLSPCLAGPQP